MAQTVSEEVEIEANDYFQRIYNNPLSINGILDVMKKLKESDTQRENEIFDCMLRHLFGEYQYFSQYPNKELYITAQLFGGIIERRIINSRTLGRALQLVLGALKKPIDSKIHYFGITALDRFKTRLKEWRSYCERIQAIRHFSELPPHLIKYVQYGLQSRESSTRPHGTVLPRSLTSVATVPKTPMKTITSATITTSTCQSKYITTSTTSLSARRSIANVTNIDKLLVTTTKEKNIVIPPEALQDMAAFILNNLSQLNLQQKCAEIQEIVTEEFWPWMARYLVVKYASVELNFHALYSNFLDCLQRPDVNKMVTRETLNNIKVLLRSEKDLTNFSNRSLLRNLGHWLGMLTLRRNKPILQLDIDLKSLLLEAYHKEQQEELLYVGPFVAKVLESCAKSRVFRPPNPWTMAIMRVLAELHQEPDLKLNLKFEIEALCKHLNIDIADLKPVVYLKNPEKLRALEYHLSTLPKNSEHASAPSQQKRDEIPIEELVESILGSMVPQTAPAAMTTPLLSTTASKPRFNYLDTSINVIANMSQHIRININLPLFQTHSNLKQFVCPTVKRAIQESLPSMVDHSIKVALKTSEQIVRKDFALDPDEVRIATAARHTVRSLTAAMVMANCRDKILASINSHLEKVFLRAMTGQNLSQKKLVEQAASVISADNVDLACVFLQKTAIEMAMKEMDKRFSNDIHLRKMAKQEGKSYCDPVAKHQAERMPEKIRLKVSGVTPLQMAVYEDFAQNIPGFLPIPKGETQTLVVPKPVMEISATTLTSNPVAVSLPRVQHVTPLASAIGNDKFGKMLEKLAGEVEDFLDATRPTASPHQYAALQNLFKSIMLMMRFRDTSAALIVLNRAVESLLKNPIASGSVVDSGILVHYRELHLKILKCFQDPSAYGMQWTNEHVTRCLVECHDKFHANFEAVDCLIRTHLLDLIQFDVTLAQAMNAGNAMATVFATQLIHSHLIDKQQTTHVTESDFSLTIKMLARMVHHGVAPEGISIARLSSLIGSLQAHRDPDTLATKVISGPTILDSPGSFEVEVKNVHDPPNLTKKTEYLLDEWMKIYHSPVHSHNPTEAFETFMQQMNIHGVLKTNASITLIFEIGTKMCVDHCYTALAEINAGSSVVRAESFRILDAFVHLIAMLVKHSNDTLNPRTKINLLNKVLGIVAGALIRDHEIRGTEFHQLPYQRILIMLFLELCTQEPLLEAFNLEVLTAFCRTFHILRPVKLAGFCYAWLELVSHREFIGRMFAIKPHKKCWTMYARLLVDLFEFLGPHLLNADLPRSVKFFYKGTLRVLLVLLHDFPEFLSDYYHNFCDVIPTDCIQLRNLILSAYPRDFRLPHPLTPDLKVDMLQEITHAPRILPNFAAVIEPSMKNELDLYMKTRTPVTFLSELTSNVQVPRENEIHCHVPLMNAVVLYVGSQAIARVRSQGHTLDMSTIVCSPHMDIFQKFSVDLEPANRYFFFNAIANQLRYPNTHTYYFYCILLCLFADANIEEIQEQITMVLLERLIANQPHPWGLLTTFNELVKNPKYKFWTREFVRSASENEKFFETIASSCMVKKQVRSILEPQVFES